MSFRIGLVGFRVAMEYIQCLSQTSAYTVARQEEQCGALTYYYSPHHAFPSLPPNKYKKILGHAGTRTQVSLKRGKPRE
jgi:hypothetical protein